MCKANVRTRERCGMWSLNCTALYYRWYSTLVHVVVIINLWRQKAGVFCSCMIVTLRKFNRAEPTIVEVRYSTCVDLRDCIFHTFQNMLHCSVHQMNNLLPSQYSIGIRAFLKIKSTLQFWICARCLRVPARKAWSMMRTFTSALQDSNRTTTIIAILARPTRRQPPPRTY